MFYLQSLMIWWACACSNDLAATMEEGTPPEGDVLLRLFSGPRNLAMTAAKYMYSFREAEETDVSIKRARMVHSGSHVSAPPPPGPFPLAMPGCIHVSRVRHIVRSVECS